MDEYDPHGPECAEQIQMSGACAHYCPLGPSCTMCDPEVHAR